MLEWSPVFETKIETIDAQHQQLFAMVNALANDITLGHESEERFNHALDELLNYALQHFADEELIMLHHHLDAGYIAIQRMEHKSFVYDINKMREELSTEEELYERFMKLARFVSSWVAYHTLRIDLMIPRQIAAIKSGKTPEEAYQLAKLTPVNPEVNKKVLEAVLLLWDVANKRIHQLEEQLAACRHSRQ